MVVGKNKSKIHRDKATVLSNKIVSNKSINRKQEKIIVLYFFKNEFHNLGCGFGCSIIEGSDIKDKNLNAKIMRFF